MPLCHFLSAFIRDVRTTTRQSLIRLRNARPRLALGNPFRCSLEGLMDKQHRRRLVHLHPSSTPRLFHEHPSTDRAREFSSHPKRPSPQRAHRRDDRRLARHRSPPTAAMAHERPLANGISPPSRAPPRTRVTETTRIAHEKNMYTAVDDIHTRAPRSRIHARAIVRASESAVLSRAPPPRPRHRERTTGGGLDGESHTVTHTSTRDTTRHVDVSIDDQAISSHTTSDARTG